MQQTVAMLESTLEHDNERPTAIVKPAEYIDQWSGMVLEDQRASNMREVFWVGVERLLSHKTKLHQVASTRCNRRRRRQVSLQSSNSISTLSPIVSFYTTRY